MKNFPSIIVTVALSFVSVTADYYLKRASESAQPYRSFGFILGVGLYAACAFGWVHVLRNTKLATIGAVYSIVVVVALAIIGVLVFREPLSTTELIGLVFAVVSLVLLSGRFA